jgi:hypothetical protein
VKDRCRQTGKPVAARLRMRGCGIAAGLII